jgi:3-hydroxybutyryl-CoA dehydrogenase
MQIGTIGVIGAGVMGSGIAQVAASKGLDVILLDVDDKAVKKGIDAVDNRLGRIVAKAR